MAAEILARHRSPYTSEVDSKRPTLSLVTDVPESLPILVDADTIPELAFARKRASAQAAEILAANRQKIIQGEWDDVPLPVDALGTARRVSEIERKFGANSPEAIDAWQGMLLDSDRLLGEAYRKNTWEYFPKARQVLEPQTERYIANGVYTLDIATRGLSPINEPEERDRRQNEYVEEDTFHVIPRLRRLGRLGLSKSLSVQIISECTTWAIEAYKANSQASHGGYVPSIKKLKLRDVSFDANGDRWQEELAVPGLYITHDVILSVLKQQGAVEPGQDYDKTELHGKQFINKNGRGVIGLIELLDNEASKVSGKNIYLGEVVPDGFDKNYAGITEQAAARQRDRQFQAVMLANKIRDLERNDTDKWAAEGIVEAYVKDLLFKEARLNPQLAAEMFDQKTADGFREVARLVSIGRTEEAIELQARVEKEAPSPSYCGSNSCGLETVESGSVDNAKAEKLGLKGPKLRDKERSCPKCKKMKVHYDMKGNKACTACEYRQINGKITHTKTSHQKD